MMSEITLDDTPQTVEMLRSVTRLWASLRQMPPKQRAVFLSALAECSDELQQVVLKMMSIVESTHSTIAERHRALTTIADALFLNPDEEDGEYGMDLVASEFGAAQRFPQLAREVARMDAQEASFAERMRSLLQARGLSQQDLADRIGCSQPAVSQMLNRQCRPQKKTILKVAEALNVDPRELWPDLDVADLLDAVASFQESDHIMTDAEAAALRDKSRKNRPKIPVRTLPKRHA